VDDERVLAFRVARSGLAARGARPLAEAAACPASDFSRDAALLALAARSDAVTPEGFAAAVDAGDEIVMAHVIRGAIHAVPRADWALYGRALLATDDAELGAQLGRQVQKLSAEHDIAPTAALEEVAAAVADGLGGGAALDRVALHQAMRERVRPELLPWCRGCESHHVAPMLWRFATVAAGARLDDQRRYVLDDPGAAPDPAEAVRRFLRFYGPATVGEFAEWAGLARPHARRLWDAVAGDLAEVDGKRSVLAADVDALADPPAGSGLRLLPPGDPLLQKVNRTVLAPDEAVRRRLFRPVASPGVVLRDGRLAGLWRAKASGRTLTVSVEGLARLRRGDVAAEAQRVADLRGLQGLELEIA